MVNLLIVIYFVLSLLTVYLILNDAKILKNAISLCKRRLRSVEKSVAELCSPKYARRSLHCLW